MAFSPSKVLIKSTKPCTNPNAGWQEYGNERDAIGKSTAAETRAPHRILGGQCEAGGVFLSQRFRLLAGGVSGPGNGRTAADLLRSESGEGQFCVQLAA